MAWMPAQLVGAADTGGLIDLATQAGLYQDSAGVTPVTGDLQPLGRLVAKANAGTAIIASQATSSAKLTWRDLAPRRATFDGSDWLTLGAGRFGRAGLFAGPSESWSIVFAGSPGNGSLLARALSADATKRTLQWYNNGTQAAPALGAHVRGATNQAIAQPASLGSVFVAGLRWDGATLRTRVNNTTGTLSVGTAAEESTDINLGGRANGTISVLTSGSWLGQAFLIDRYLSDQEWDWLFYSMSQAVGLVGIGTAPPSQVVLDPVSVCAPAAVQVSALQTATALGSVTATAQAAVTVAPLITATALSALEVSAAAQVEVSAPLTDSVLSEVEVTAPAEAVSAPLVTSTVLGPVTAQASATVQTTPLETRAILGACSAVAPAAVEVAGLGEEPVLSAVVAASLAQVSVQPLITEATLGQVAAVAPATVQVAPLILDAVSPSVPPVRLATRSLTKQMQTVSVTARLASRSKTPYLNTTTA